MLYILTGLPYSGKTTLTQELTKRFGFSSVSMDDIITQKKLSADTMTQTDWDSVYSTGYEQLKQLLLAGKTVVLDMANLKHHERNTAKNIAQSLGISSKLIYLNIPPSEIKSRWSQNVKTRQRDQLSQSLLDQALQMFEPPTPEENFITFNQTMDLNQWIQKHITYK